MANIYGRTRLGLSTLLALTAAAAIAPAAPAAAAGPDFELEITWLSFSLPERDSCDPTGPIVGGPRVPLHPTPECGAWERVNASMSVEGGTVVGYRVRNIGTWDRGPRNWERTENWSSTAYPDFPVFIGSSTSFAMADRPMCQTETYRWCRTSFEKKSNTVKIRGNYGDKVRLNFHAQTTDGQEGCLIHDEYTWTQARVDLYNSWNARLAIMSARYDGHSEDICRVGFQVVARKL
ncbi:hypothetical protein [Microbispora sp. H10836]|uniref:hypothetical protein n=1 Tax=Microbispora sp. H10836 TaxID=2729106 RepID=UPI0014738695|nr:hypothetical protein [Microbispora sp. H10836]